MPRNRIKTAVLFLLVFAIQSVTTTAFTRQAVLAASAGATLDASLPPPVPVSSHSAGYSISQSSPAPGALAARWQQMLLMQDLLAFAQEVQNGKAGQVTGVFASGILALPVVQQPPGKTTYVSTRRGVATQFGLAARHGTIGLLAHNYLAGRAFFDILVDQEIFVVYGDGATERYVVEDIRRFEALQPHSPQSEFIDLETRAHLSAGAVFRQIYAREGMLVLQTCIANKGVSSWGRIFVIARRAD